VNHNLASSNIPAAPVIESVRPRDVFFSFEEYRQNVIRAGCVPQEFDQFLRWYGGRGMPLLVGRLKIDGAKKPTEANS